VEIPSFIPPKHQLIDIPSKHEFVDTSAWERIIRVFEESDESERQNWFLNSTATHHSEAA